jgi:hypothetical protein
LHTLIHLISAVILLIATGIISGKWFALEKAKPFSINRQMFRSKYFWLGVGVGLVFLFADYRFQHYMALPT